MISSQRMRFMHRYKYNADTDTHAYIHTYMYIYACVYMITSAAGHQTCVQTSGIYTHSINNWTYNMK